jgi:PhnB protein
MIGGDVPHFPTAIPRPRSRRITHAPDLLMKLYTQLNFGGNCDEAFRFYAEHLGGEITMMMRRSEAPGAPAGADDPVIHARMNIGETVLIANDVPSSTFQKMRSAYLYLSLDSADEVERVYALLGEGGEIFMPMEETFYATRFAMLRDRFGVSWTILNERPRA